MAGNGRALVRAVDDEVVSLGLAGHREIECLVQEPVCWRSPQSRAKINGIFLAETHKKSARAGDPHAVAAFAEIMRKRRDESQAAACLGDFEIARGASRFVLRLAQGESLAKPRLDEIQRQILVCSPGSDLAKRHDFDQSE